MYIIFFLPYVIYKCAVESFWYMESEAIFSTQSDMNIARKKKKGQFLLVRIEKVFPLL